MSRRRASNKRKLGEYLNFCLSASKPGMRSELTSDNENQVFDEQDNASKLSENCEALSAD